MAPSGDVVDKGAVELAVGGLQVVDREFDGNEVSVAGAEMAFVDVRGGGPGMHPVVAPALEGVGGIDVRDGQGEQFGAGISQETTGRFVDVGEAAGAINPDDRLAGAIERKLAQVQGFIFLAGDGNVLEGGQEPDDRSGLVAQRNLARTDAGDAAVGAGGGFFDIINRLAGGNDLLVRLAEGAGFGGGPGHVKVGLADDLRRARRPVPKAKLRLQPRKVN